MTLGAYFASTCGSKLAKIRSVFLRTFASWWSSVERINLTYFETFAMICLSYFSMQNDKVFNAQRSSLELNIIETARFSELIGA